MPKKFDFLSPGIQITEIDESVISNNSRDEGPIIIGRTRMGPGMQPVKIRNLSDYIKVFGKPVPGPTGTGDVWRDGPNLSAPTYAAYAAQAWLASGNSPITVIRLLGDQVPNLDDGSNGMAGWQLTNAPAGSHTGAIATNGSAYGLFIADNSAFAQGESFVFGADTGFSISNLEDDINAGPNPTIIQFIRRETADLATNSSGHAVADGLLFEIDFNDDTASEAGTATKALDGTENVPKYTCGINGYSTATEVMAVIETAIEAAIADGTISAVSVANKGATLKIQNTDTDNFLLVANIDNERDQFHVVSGILGANGNAATNDSTRGGIAAGAAKATAACGTGALAAILHCDSGYLELATGNGDGNVSGSCRFVDSIGDDLMFGLKVYNSSGIIQGGINKFNFNKQSAKYIRKVLNTNPQLTNTDMTALDNRKTYWVGETFERHLKSFVTGSGATNQQAILLPLAKKNQPNGAIKDNWSYNRVGHKPATTGWVISQDKGENTVYSPTLDSASLAGCVKLFRFECLHSGDDIQREIMIGIEDIKESNAPKQTGFGTFTVCVKDLNGNTLEMFSDCSLNPSDPNAVWKKIGDQALSWDDNNRRFNMDGNYINRSDYIRVVMKEEPSQRNYADDDLPFGFLGQGRPKTFMLVSGSTTAYDEFGVSFSGPFIQGSGSVPGQDFGTTQELDANDAWAGVGHLVSFSASHGSQQSPYTGIKFEFPKLQLRQSGSEGFATNQYKQYYGIRPKNGKQSTSNDVDYVDYIRALPATYDGHGLTPSGDFEYSFVFSLDNIRIDDATRIVTYESGSRRVDYSVDTAGRHASYTVKSGSSGLLDAGVKQFYMPLFGGRHGMDITEPEPFRNAQIKSTGLGSDDLTNYLQYTINKALDSVEDPDFVPANMLIAPGFYVTEVTDKVLAIAETRKDVLAVIDIENDYKSVYESTESLSDRRGAVNSAVSSLQQRDIQTSFACAFYPSVQIVDRFNNNRRVWIPSSVAGFGGIAQSEAASAAWFAPAGFNRGGLGRLGGRAGPKVIQARQRLDSDQRDKLYSRVNVNPIATFPNEGVVIFGQKTLQIGIKSALDRINVRRLLLYLKSRISAVARNILFDNNVEATWNRFIGEADPILADVQARFGLTEYKLVLDDTTTTPDLIDQNIMYAQVYLKPARAIEFIAIDFIVSKTGAEFA